MTWTERFGIVDGRWHAGPTREQFQSFVLATCNALAAMGRWSRKGPGRPARDQYSGIVGAYATKVYGFTGDTARAYLLDADADCLWRGEGAPWLVPPTYEIRRLARGIKARDLRHFARLYREFSEIDGQAPQTLAPRFRPAKGYRPRRMHFNVDQAPVNDAVVARWLAEWDRRPPHMRKGIQTNPRISSPS